jgi:hypothetical protein
LGVLDELESHALRFSKQEFQGNRSKETVCSLPPAPANLKLSEPSALAKPDGGPCPATIGLFFAPHIDLRRQT